MTTMPSWALISESVLNQFEALWSKAGFIWIHSMQSESIWIQLDDFIFFLNQLESFWIISEILWIKFSIGPLLNQKNSDDWISLNHSTLQNKVWIYLNNIWIIQNFLLPTFPTLNLCESFRISFYHFQSLKLSELHIWMIQTYGEERAGCSA